MIEDLADKLITTGDKLDKMLRDFELRAQDMVVQAVKKERERCVEIAHQVAMDNENNQVIFSTCALVARMIAEGVEKVPESGNGHDGS